MFVKLINRAARIAAAAALVVCSSSMASVVGSQVDNFRLLDHNGVSHELYYYRDAPAIALLVHDSQCQAANQAQQDFAALAETYRQRGVEFFLLNSETGVSRDAFDQSLPVLMDDAQIIGRALNVTTAGEVLLVDPDTWSVVYQGGVAAAATAGDLRDAIDSVVANEEVAAPHTVAQGCNLDLGDVVTQVSYAEDVAPILLEKCVNCHHQGGIGSWAMSDYNMVRGFSLMIREVVRTKRMPPWHADPETGHWSNDRSLSTEEVQTLVNWIEAGAPKEGAADPLAEADLSFPTWEISAVLGEPDYVIDIPATEVPATGVVDYIDQYVENTIGKDVWVQAAEILPGDRTVLHHTISIFGERSWFDKLVGDITPLGALRHYAPGISNRPFPENTGVFLPKDAVFEFQMHYTTTGRATVDQSKMGIWVYEEPPENTVRSFFMQNRRIEIPAHAANHREEKRTKIPKDALLYSLLPHAHYRGKAAEFRAVYPDGSEEILLSVPQYDFNWQTAYEFAEPKFVPAGTELVQTGWWDNSARNLANPDPSIDVEWGDQSWEEMLFGEVTLRFVEAEEARALKAKLNRSVITAQRGTPPNEG